MCILGSIYFLGLPKSHISSSLVVSTTLCNEPKVRHMVAGSQLQAVKA